MAQLHWSESDVSKEGNQWKDSAPCGPGMGDTALKWVKPAYTGTYLVCRL